MDNAFIPTRHDISHEAPARVPTSNPQARRSSSIDNASVAFHPDLSRSSFPTSRQGINNEATASVGAQAPANHTRARRRKTIDNVSIRLQFDHHRGSAPTGRDISDDPTSQVHAKHTVARQSSSIDNASIAFLPDLSHSSFSTSRQGINDETTAPVGAQVPARHTRARRRKTIDNVSIGKQLDHRHGSAPTGLDITDEASTRVPIAQRQASRSSCIDNSSIARPPYRHANNEATAFADAQVSTKHTRAGRSSSGDNVPIAFLPDLQRNAAQKSRCDISNEATSSVVAQLLAKHIRERCATYKAST
jgi:hypothetical protein